MFPLLPKAPTALHVVVRGQEKLRIKKSCVETTKSWTICMRQWFSDAGQEQRRTEIPGKREKKCGRLSVFPGQFW